MASYQDQQYDDADLWDRPTPRVDARERVVPDGKKPAVKRRTSGSRTTTLLVSLIVVLLIGALGGGWYLLDRMGMSPLAMIGAGGSGAAGPAAEVIATSGPQDLKTTPGNAIGPGTTVNGAQTVLLASKQLSPSPAGTTQGVYYQLPADVVTRMGGKVVRVVITARAAATNPTARFAVAYSGAGANTGWMVFTPSASFQPFNLTFRLPPAKEAAPANIGIWSDLTGQGKVLEVQSVSVELPR